MSQPGCHCRIRTGKASVAMTENETIEALKLEGGIEITGRPIRLAQFFEGIDSAIKALEEVQRYRQIGTVEECIKNKGFLDFLSDKMNPNDFETYLRLYNALEEKGCEE